jgi:NADH:ubiquinone oxidoreductase subunit 3 (subunit A)
MQKNERPGPFSLFVFLLLVMGITSACLFPVYLITNYLQIFGLPRGLIFFAVSVVLTFCYVRMPIAKRYRAQRLSTKQPNDTTEETESSPSDEASD